MRLTQRQWSGLWAGLALTAGSLPAGDFTLRLGLVHGHLAEVFIGCAAGATPGYDAKVDDLAPPPGIETGFTVLVPPVNNVPPLYKDIRGFADTVVWKLHARVWKDKPIQVSWDSAALPAEYDFTAQLGDRTVDMRQTPRLDVPETRDVVITATRRPAAKPDAPAAR